MLSLWCVTDGVEEHHVVAEDGDEAEKIAARWVTSEEKFIPSYDIQRAPIQQDSKHSVHYEDAAMAEDLVNLVDGLSLDREESRTPVVYGPASAWVETVRRGGPSFISSTLY